MQWLGSKIKHFNVRAGIVFLLPFIIACQNTHPYKGSLWRVTDPQSRKLEKSLYILGSVHGFSRSDIKLSDAINKAFNESPILAVEINPDHVKEDIKDLLDTNLLLFINDVTTAYLKSYFFEVGASNEQFEKILRMHPYAVISFLETQAPPTKMAKYNIGSVNMLNHPGVDAKLIALAKLSNKEIVNLETAKDIIQIWKNNCPGKDDYSALLSTLLDFLTGKRNVPPNSIKALESLTSGDSDAFLDWYNSQENQLEVATIIRQKCSNIPRNRFWVKSFLELTKNEKNVFAVVGIAHLVGRDNLVELLRRQGLRVEEIVN